MVGRWKIISRVIFPFYKKELTPYKSKTITPFRMRVKLVVKIRNGPSVTSKTDSPFEKRKLHIKCGQGNRRASKSL